MSNPPRWYFDDARRLAQWAYTDPNVPPWVHALAAGMLDAPNLLANEKNPAYLREANEKKEPKESCSDG